MQAFGAISQSTRLGTLPPSWRTGLSKCARFTFHELFCYNLLIFNELFCYTLLSHEQGGLYEYNTWLMLLSTRPRISLTLLVMVKVHTCQVSEATDIEQLGRWRYIHLTNMIARQLDTTTSIQATIVIPVFFLLLFCLRSHSYRMYSNAKHHSEIHFFDAPTMTENKQLHS
jgi:hypothetical protein